jgi:hypothetical protein
LLFVQGKKRNQEALEAKKIIIKGSSIKQTNTKNSNKRLYCFGNTREREEHLRSKEEEEEEEEGS